MRSVFLVTTIFIFSNVKFQSFKNIYAFLVPQALSTVLLKGLNKWINMDILYVIYKYMKDYYHMWLYKRYSIYKYTYLYVLF